MSEQQQTQQEATPNDDGQLTDDQLLSGASLVEQATNDFMNTTFQMGDDDKRAIPEEAQEEDKQTFDPEPSDKLELSSDVVELERREADLRQRERDMQDMMERMEEMQEKPPEFREDPWQAFARWSQENGVDPSQAYERLTANLLDEDKELIEQEQREGRWEKAETRIQELEEQLQGQAHEQEEQQLWVGLESRLEEMKEQWPVAAARGVQAVGDVFYTILDHYEDTGEVLDAGELFEQYNNGLQQQLQELAGNNAVRQLLGLSAQQQNTPNVAAREVVRGTPTLTNQSAGGRSFRTDQDEVPDNEELIRMAAEAFLSGD